MNYRRTFSILILLTTISICYFTFFKVDILKYLRTLDTKVITPNSAVYVRDQTGLILQTNIGTVKTRGNITNHTDAIMILLWTKCANHLCFPLGIYNGPHFKCEVTEDSSKIKEAHAVVFQTCTMRNLLKAGIPTYRSPSQKWIFLCAEPPPKKPLKFPELKDTFNFTMTTRLDSNYHTYHGFYNLSRISDIFDGPK
ncbi:unnamed protein product [Owenia fusiformis]|uniref:Fucosyltransferase N-terminal domain-containing protein n=1 Tax=Owenia fusiformis TaxID=6347 RepID=A0A8S4Q4Y8_OWEFU|nr:unnamed protein product [Owenia fusiformis]